MKRGKIRSTRSRESTKSSSLRWWREAAKFKTEKLTQLGERLNEGERK